MSFRDDINKFKDQIKDDVVARVEYLALYVFRGLISKSPVDTGRFRASWTIAEGVPVVNNVTTGGTPENPLPPPEQPTSLSLPLFPVVFINNSLPYGERLENGYSKQAPAGMVGLTLAEVEAFNL